MSYHRRDPHPKGFGIRLRWLLTTAGGLVLLVAAAGPGQAQEAGRGWEAVVPDGMERSYERSRYAPAVRMGNYLILSGVIGYNGGADDNSPETQFVRAFERLSDVLEGAGLSLDDVAEITTYHVDLGDLGERFIEVKNRYLDGPPYPAWTAIGVDRLFLDGALIEIRAVAVLPESDGEGQ